jgi:translation initiation factor 2 beta subunit (eIF-2beta)/eIF-5
MTDIEGCVVECDYEFDTLLDRAYEILEGKTNGIKKKLVFNSPIIKLENRKTYIINFIDICKSMNRDSEEVKKYIDDELKIPSSVTEDGKLKINAVLTSKIVNFQNLIISYAKKYILCPICKSANTSEEIVNRIKFITCNICKARNCIEKN